MYDEELQVTEEAIEMMLLRIATSLFPCAGLRENLSFSALYLTRSHSVMFRHQVDS